MEQLTSVIDSCFSSYARNRWFRHSRNSNGTKFNMVIPAFNDCFELPVIALPKFRELVTENNTDYDDIVVCLDTSQYSNSHYKTLDATIRDTFNSNYAHGDNSLVRIIPKNTDTEYYITNGTIFSKNLTPLVMLSWIIQKDNEGCYQFKRPILRVDPRVFINKSDEVQRYIINKITSASLSNTSIRTPYIDSVSMSRHDAEDTSVKVEIDKCPFSFLTSDSPSISTTNKELLQIVLDHIDEVIQ